MNRLTKIVCERVKNDKFIVLVLRNEQISKSDLNLKPSKETTLKITNPAIKTLILSRYAAFLDSKLSLEDFFGINIVIGINRNRDKSNPLFNLQHTTFDEDREV